MPTAERVVIFFMGSLPTYGKLIKFKGAFHTLCLILQFAVVSAAKAELQAIFLNFQEGMIFRSNLEDMGNPQPKIPVHCNNVITIGIANNTIKSKHCEQWK